MLAEKINDKIKKARHALNAPTNGATFAAPGGVAQAVTAGDADGSIFCVDFYRGATLLGCGTNAPYCTARVCRVTLGRVSSRHG